MAPLVALARARAVSRRLRAPASLPCQPGQENAAAAPGGARARQEPIEGARGASSTSAHPRRARPEPPLGPR
eukprot:4296669-Pyramimonas_sp.AAC.1